MTDPQLSGDHTRPHPSRCHLDDLQPDVVGQGPSVDEDSPELVDSALSLEGIPREEGHFIKSGNFVNSLNSACTGKGDSLCES